MGVLACDRKKCENIMCGRYSYEHGYLCYECFDELVSSGPETNITNFMESVKHTINAEAAFARFNIEFPETNN
jgi:hypothetical protein